MKEHIKYAPMALFGVFCLKAMILGISGFEMGALFALGAFAAYYEKAKNDKFEKDVLAKLQAMEARFNAVDAHITQLYKNDKGITDELAKIKLPQSMKAQSFGRM